MNQVKSALGVASLAGVLLTGSMFASPNAQAAVGCSTTTTLSAFISAGSCQDQDKLYTYTSNQNLPTGNQLTIKTLFEGPIDIHEFNYKSDLTALAANTTYKLKYTIDITEPSRVFTGVQFGADLVGNATATKLIQLEDGTDLATLSPTGTYNIAESANVKKLLITDTIITGDAPAVVNSFTNTFRQQAVSAAVPEPLTILGTGTALGMGAFFKRQQAKKQQKEKAK